MYKVNVSEILDYALAKYQVAKETYCAHLRDRKEKEALQYMQNTSIILFFLLVHVPLSKMSAACSFATGFTVWFLDNKTKAVIYRMCTFITRAIINPAEACRQWRKSAKVDSMLALGTSL